MHWVFLIIKVADFYDDKGKNPIFIVKRDKMMYNILFRKKHKNMLYLGFPKPILAEKHLSLLSGCFPAQIGPLSKPDGLHWSFYCLAVYLLLLSWSNKYIIALNLVLFLLTCILRSTKRLCKHKNILYYKFCYNFIYVQILKFSTSIKFVH